MDCFLEYAKSSRSRCKRCEDPIEKDTLRFGQFVENHYLGTSTVHYVHFGCLTPAQVSKLGVNISGFHSLAGPDQIRLTNAIKARRIPDEDISPALRPPPTLPQNLAPSQNAAALAAAAPADPFPSKKPRGSSLMKPRKSRPGASGTPGSSQGQMLASPRASSSSQIIDLSTSPAKPVASTSTLPTSSQSQLIDLTSSPPKAVSSPVASSSRMNGSSLSSPASAARGRLIQAEDDDDDENDGINDAVSDVFYMRHPDEVVGIQHYRGLVGVGEQVTLRRQPNNAYDSNAIQVMNAYNQQVGHIPRGTAGRLAPLMDKKYITVEGTMLTGNIGKAGYKLKIVLDIYGQPSSREQLAPYLTWAGSMSETGLPPSVPDGSRASTGVNGSSLSPKKGKSKSRAAEETEAEKSARRVMEGLKDLEKGGEEKSKDAVMDTLTRGIDVLKLPLHSSPPSRRSGDLLNDLLPHQSQGLLWMQEHENPKLPTGDDHVQLWQRKSTPLPLWLNLATLTPQAMANPPELGRGGIMADAMGLGKTLTIISLVLATKNEVPAGFCGATLVVCPLSVLSNWHNQLEEHVKPGKLKSIIFYGDNRNFQQSEIDAADVVVTTYETLTSELSAGKKGKSKVGRLLDTKWKRVVLDEGHAIRNPKAVKTRACIALVAHCRWVVTGTPIVNGAKDLGSLLSFLRICKPLDDPDHFRRHIMRTLPTGTGAMLLQAIMSQSCIRRTKEMEDQNGNRLVPLPPVSFYSVKVDLYEEDRKIYDMAMAASKRKFEEFLANDRTGSLPPNVLQLLTRLRQLACMSALVPAGYFEDLQKDEERHTATTALSKEARNKLIWKLKAAIDDSAECPVCMDTMAQPRITMCGHCYCLACISEVIQLQALCPMDRIPLPSLDHVLKLPEVMPAEEGEEESAEEDAAGEVDALQSSAKIDELVKYITAFPKGEKSLIFSQFTKFLGKIEPHLIRAGIKTVRLDGSLSHKRRAQIIDEFQRPADAEAESEADNGGAVDSDATEESDEDEESNKSLGDDDDDDDDFEPLDAKSRKRKNQASQSSKKKLKGTKQNNTKAKGKGKAKGKPLPATAGPTVMLISLQCGSQGLNLTAAQNVFLVDPWWNSAITLQAIDRVNRIGQKAKEVRVFEIVAKNTVEDQILEIQAKKNELIQQAFAGTRAKETARQKKEARFNEIAALFGVDQKQVGGDAAAAGGSGSRDGLVQTTLG